MPHAQPTLDPNDSTAAQKHGIPEVAVFSAKAYDREFLNAANEQGTCRLRYFDAALDAETRSFLRCVMQESGGPSTGEGNRRGARLKP